MGQWMRKEGREPMAQKIQEAERAAAARDRQQASKDPGNSDCTPRGLETGAPELGMADFTEIRNVPRPFPENAEERACYQYLLEQMQAAPDGPHQRKDEFEEFCRGRFHVTVDSFDYCWREANKVTGAGWDQPGRPSRQKLSR
jgi:hypothetical protein